MHVYHEKILLTFKTPNFGCSFSGRCSGFYPFLLMDPLNLPRKVSGMTLSTLAKGFYSTMPLGRKVDREPLACEDAWYKL